MYCKVDNLFRLVLFFQNVFHGSLTMIRQKMTRFYRSYSQRITATAPYLGNAAHSIPLLIFGFFSPYDGIKQSGAVF